jgi:hypothetical protein
MSALSMAERVEEYLAYRRAMGYQVRTRGGMLRSFARSADESGHLGPLTTEIALRRARLPERAARLYPMFGVARRNPLRGKGRIFD